LIHILFNITVFT